MRPKTRCRRSGTIGFHRVSVKVYLDNDVFVRASKDKPIDALKELARAKSITLYTSQLGYVEYSEWPKAFRARYQGAWKSYRLQKTAESIRVLREIDDERKRLEGDREKEWAYWNVEFQHPKSTFEGLMVAAILGEAIIEFDAKGELKLLDNLVHTHRIGVSDAQHLMIGHSASLDWILTWDKRLIRKAAKVEWLHPRVQTPETFFSTWRR